MAPRLSEDLRKRILVWYQEQGKNPQEIATLAGCSIRTVYYILSFNRDYASTRNPFARAVGRLRSLDIGDMNYLISLITARPKTYLDELQEALFTAKNVDVSIATISRALRQWEMSYNDWIV